MNDTQLTITGNLVDDPELRFTPSGQPVARFRIASTPRFYNKQANEWQDGESLFLTCQVWRQAAENVAESLQRGMRVIVSGRLRQRSYEANDGTKRTVYEVEVDDVGPSLRNASAKVTKASRSSAGNGGQRQAETDPWAAGDEPPF
jgi:single-strand DNA-binding protein